MSSITTVPSETLGLARLPEFALDERTARVLELRRLDVGHDRGWLIRRALVAADALALTLAFAIGTVASSGVAFVGSTLFLRELALVLAAVPVWVLAAKVAGLYDRDGRHASYTTIDDIAPVFHIATLAAVLSLFVWHASGARPDWTLIGVMWLASVPLVTVAHACARGITRTRVGFLQNTVIVGAGDVGQAVARKFLQHPETGINIVGFVDSEPKERRDDLDHLALLGSPEDLPRFVKLLDVDRVVIAFSNDNHEDELTLIREMRDLNVQVDIVPRLFDLIGPGVEVHSIEGMPLIGLSTLRLSRSSMLVKRSVDVALSLIALVVLAPLFLAAALAIKLDSGGPVFFRQTRMGDHDTPFGMFKFRTMVVDADDRKDQVAHLNRHAHAGGDVRMFKIVNDPRVTRPGRVLRKYFIDEMPQLLNVLRGEMSLIGPRPLILEEAAFVDSWGHRRLDLKPGMTGIWQVLGRSAISFEEMVKLDYLYVTTWSLASDFRLLLRTVPLMLRGEAPV